MSEMLSGAEMLIRALQDEGVEYLFGYPGGAALHIYDAIFKQQKVEHILVRHEQAATHMADGYARATGKPGVVLVTSGPGATNAITGIATAHMDSIAHHRHLRPGAEGEPARHGRLPRDGHGGHFAPGGEAQFPREGLPRKSRWTVKKAFYIATSGRPGPVVIDVPKDATDPAVTAKFEYAYPKRVSMRSYNPVTAWPTGGQIRKPPRRLLHRKRKRPVIYSGWRRGAGGCRGRALTAIGARRLGAIRSRTR